MSFVFGISGVRQDNRVQITKGGRSANPFEKKEAIFGGKSEINDEEVGKRMVSPADVRWFAEEIIEGLLNVADDSKGSVEMLFSAGALENECVVLIIFDDQNDPGRLVPSFFQRMRAFCSANTSPRNSDEIVS